MNEEKIEEILLQKLLQQKVNVVLEYRERQDVLADAEEKEALAEVKKNERGKSKK